MVVGWVAACGRSRARPCSTRRCRRLPGHPRTHHSFACSSGALTELPPLTGYEPNRIAEDQDYRYFTGDGQSTEHEDLRVRPFSFHQSITASTYDSAESIATLPESDLDDEQLRALLASPLCTYRSEKQVQNDRKFITLNEKT